MVSEHVILVVSHRGAAAVQDLSVHQAFSYHLHRQVDHLDLQNPDHHRRDVLACLFQVVAMANPTRTINYAL